MLYQKRELGRHDFWYFYKNVTPQTISVLFPYLFFSVLTKNHLYLNMPIYFRWQVFCLSLFIGINSLSDNILVFSCWGIIPLIRTCMVVPKKFVWIFWIYLLRPPRAIHLLYKKLTSWHRWFSWCSLLNYNHRFLIACNLANI